MGHVIGGLYLRPGQSGFEGKISICHQNNVKQAHMGVPWYKFGFYCRVKSYDQASQSIMTHRFAFLYIWMLRFALVSSCDDNVVGGDSVTTRRHYDINASLDCLVFTLLIVTVPVLAWIGLESVVTWSGVNNSVWWIRCDEQFSDVLLWDLRR
jgi:hypothetical protein